MPLSVSTDAITLKVDASIATLLLANPARHNALGMAELEGIESAIETVESDPSVRVLVITASPGNTFCAGADLAEIRSGALSPSRFHQCLDRVANCSRPTIAAINGHVYGGGAELPLACDFRIGVTGMHLRVPATQIGLCYPPSGIQRYTQLLGPANAKRILLAGETCSADTLCTMGYVSDVVPQDALGNTVTQLAQTLATHAPLAMHAVKSLINQAASGQWDAAVADALESRCATSHDLKRGLDAALNKQTAAFKGD